MQPASITFGLTPVGMGSRLEAVQFLPARRERIFEFFCDAHQLEPLTPAWLRFMVRTPRPIDLKQGARIDYQLRLHGVPIRWQSCIDVWEPPYRFVDVQIRGPYRHWRHEHVFEEADGGTVCRDIVDYAVPGGWLVERFFVRDDVQKIFEYRQRRLEEFFPPLSTEAHEPVTLQR
jgi:ligand-binding SRPBCC domain-containing protein